jgi:hypothetical protein
MSASLEPGFYRIKYTVDNIDKPKVGGEFATDNGKDHDVTVEPASPPFAGRQVVCSITLIMEVYSNYHLRALVGCCYRGGIRRALHHFPKNLWAN